ncbi:MAG TPA: rhomboid family intramembrane serine protease [Chitinophagales bacterium]|nr:rhomboid family intramembrane serine protease [Chitinophagales bacterium]
MINEEYLENSEYISYGDFTEEQFYTLAVETIKKLNWEISIIDEDGLTTTSINSKSDESEFCIVLGDENVELNSIANKSEQTNFDNIEQFKTVFYQLKATFSKEEIEEKQQQLYEQIGEKVIEEDTSTEDENNGHWWDVFMPVKDYFFTPIIININIGLFILMLLFGVKLLNPYNDDLIKWGANYAPYTINGQWWRIVTSNYIHIGIWHILVNMYVLLIFGATLESIIGSKKFILVYLISGIFGSLGTLYFLPWTVSAGASGAIFGIIGTYLALATTKLFDKKAKKEVLPTLILYVIISIIPDSETNIYAHAGGLFTGLIIGYFYSYTFPHIESEKKENLILIGLVGIYFTLGILIFQKAPNPSKYYDEQFKIFREQEDKALNIPDLETVKSQLYIEYLQDTSIYYWNKNIQLLNQLDTNKLPKWIIDDNNLLKEYCNYRITEFQFIILNTKEETSIYNDSINWYGQKIETLLNTYNN